jgi:hypothetical protein
MKTYKYSLRTRVTGILWLVLLNAVVFGSLVAYGQNQAPTPAPSTGLDWHNIFNLVIKGSLSFIFVTFIPTVVVPALPKLPGLTAQGFTWLNSKIAMVKNAWVQGVLLRASSLLQQKVVALEQTEVAALKDKLASGTVTVDQLPSLLETIKQTAIQQAQADFTAQGLVSDLNTVFGGDQSALMKWIINEIENHVFNLPSSGIAAMKATMKAAAPKKA